MGVRVCDWQLGAAKVAKVSVAPGTNKASMIDIGVYTIRYI
jgi:hypothetical protein